MPDSYAHPAPYDQEQTETCQRCDHKWKVQGMVEFGCWSPLDESDMNCPECGRNVLEG